MTKLRLFLFILGIVTGITEGSGSPLQELTNDLTDEIINHFKFGLLCNLDPLILPGIRTENGFVELIVSQIKAKGIRNLKRIGDIQVQKCTGPKAVNSTCTGDYNISATFGIRDLKIEFRFQAVNIFSNKWVDIHASGLAELDINFEIQVSPSQRKIQLASMAIENMDPINWNLSGQLVHSEWLLSSFEAKINTEINKEIDSSLTKAINEAILDLNKKIEVFMYFFPPVDSCPAAAEDMNNCANLPPIPISIEAELLGFGPISLKQGEELDVSGMSTISIDLKNKTVGKIPPAIIYTRSDGSIRVDGVEVELTIPQEFGFLKIVQLDPKKPGQQVLTFSNSRGNLFFDGYKKYDRFYYSKPASYKYFDFPGHRLENYAGDTYSPSFYIKLGALYRGEEKIMDLPNVLAYHDGGKIVVKGRIHDYMKSYENAGGMWDLNFSKGGNDSLALYLPSDNDRQFNLMRFIDKNALI